MRRLVILGIASLLFLAGCGGRTARTVNSQPAQPSPVAPQPTQITVSPPSAMLQTGGLQEFITIVSPSGANQAVTWSVSLPLLHRDDLDLVLISAGPLR